MTYNEELLEHLTKEHDLTSALKQMHGDRK